MLDIKQDKAQVLLVNETTIVALLLAVLSLRKIVQHVARKSQNGLTSVVSSQETKPNILLRLRCVDAATAAAASRTFIRARTKTISVSEKATADTFEAETSQRKSSGLTR